MVEWLHCPAVRDSQLNGFAMRHTAIWKLTILTINNQYNHE